MADHFFRYTLSEFTSLLKDKYGKKEFYSHGIFREIYKKGNLLLEDLSIFEKAESFRQVILEEMPFSLPEVGKTIQEGDTFKFTLKTSDGYETESVIIPMSHYRTICVSSQIGCKMGCTFCETGQMGLVRNLRAEEIVQQIYFAIHVFGYEIRNIVFMGMGEPFDNFDEVIQAVKIVTEDKGFSFGKSQITISTVGRVDGLQKLGKLGWHRLNVAISLNAANDELRSYLMPINRVTPLAELQKAMLDYPHRKSGLFLIEYVLIKDVNDSREHLEELVAFLKPIRARLNLIPYNPRSNSPFEKPSEEDVQRFYQWLIEEGVFVCRRMTKGQAVMAACGQLGNLDYRFGRKPF